MIRLITFRDFSFQYVSLFLKNHLFRRGLFTPSESWLKSEKDRRSSKNKRQTSKKFFVFASAFVRCEWAFKGSIFVVWLFTTDNCYLSSGHAAWISYHLKVNKQWVLKWLLTATIFIRSNQRQIRQTHVKRWIYDVFILTSNQYGRPQTKLRKGNVFTSVCQEFCPGGADTRLGQTRQTPPPRQAGTSLLAGRCPLAGRHPPGRHTPGRQTHTPPADGYCSGRYASYWNAFLLLMQGRGAASTDITT